MPVGRALCCTTRKTRENLQSRVSGVELLTLTEVIVKVLRSFEIAHQLRVPVSIANVQIGHQSDKVRAAVVPSTLSRSRAFRDFCPNT